MFLEKNLNVSRESFFKQISLSIVNEVFKYTGKSIEINEIKSGLSYTKSMSTKVGTKGDIKVTIEEYSEPNLYKVKFEGKEDINYLSYILEEINQNECKVKYMEEFVTDSKIKNMNYKWISKLYDRGSKKKVNNIINNIESYIINQKL